MQNLNSNYKKKYLLRLKKRKDFLEVRTNNNPNLTYDMAELNALNWAIKTLSSLYGLDENFNKLGNSDDQDVKLYL